jgi:S1-C subfamily serine protease
MRSSNPGPDDPRSIRTCRGSLLSILAGSLLSGLEELMAFGDSALGATSLNDQRRSGLFDSTPCSPENAFRGVLMRRLSAREEGRYMSTKRTLQRGVVAFGAAIGGSLQIASAAAQANPGTLRVEAVLIDAELQPRPVPKHALFLKCGDATPIRVVTGFDGKAELAAEPGECVLESERPAEFQQRSFRWSVPVSIKDGAVTAVELSNDNAAVEAVSQPTSSGAPDFPKLFREWQGSVVTVWSESGHGTGFLVDEGGIILTNEHVVHGSDYVAIQFDERTKVRGKVLAADSERDVAAVRIHPAAVKAAKPVSLASAQDLERPMEGEPVFTIGSPLNQSRVMTTGIVSKVERRAIISDVNINHGNSGGPLFAANGKVLGITTFGDFTTQGGPGISGVVRIDQVGDVLVGARAAMATSEAPSPDLLPVDPAEAYPVAAIKAALAGRHFKTFQDEAYGFGAGDFDVQFQTPVLTAGLAAVYSQELHKEQGKRSKKAGKEEAPNPALAGMRDWTEYVGDNVAVFVVRAAPKLKEGFMSGLSRGLAAAQGYYGGPAKLNFATDFVSMKLFCGANEVQPIRPNRVQVARDVDTTRVRVRDAAYYGFYTFPHDAIVGCGPVRLEIVSLKKQGQPEVKYVPTKIVERVSGDFAPYREHLDQLGPAR